MAFMILGMGLPGGVIGWLGRTNEDKKAGVKQKQLHENIMVAFWLLAFAGATGGVLSTVMQGKDILTSPHAKTAGVVLALLTANAVVAYSGFTVGGEQRPRGASRAAPSTPTSARGRALHCWCTPGSGWSICPTFREWGAGAVGGVQRGRRQEAVWCLVLGCQWELWIGPR
eukprot:TRINITY_DN4015_c0_g1_i1.p2 TRINITY_DN4015_c0_g1~~TRINITY_DN4015_c0_g1_i1.p2  ORF type:complete len:171 (+),score=26.93 TRINITY_DN4015_c0_g1_i1:416-928(+)